MLNVKTLTDTMSRMELPQLQQYAALHKNDPYVVTLALSIANQKKQMQASQAGQAGMQPQPKVVDQDIAQMLAPPPQQMPPQQMLPQQMAAAPQQQALPEDQGIGQLPAQNMQRMAEGGIVAFDEGGDVPGFAGPTGSYIDPSKYVRSTTGGKDWFLDVPDTIRDPSVPYYRLIPNPIASAVAGKTFNSRQEAIDAANAVLKPAPAAPDAAVSPVVYDPATATRRSMYEDKTVAPPAAPPAAPSVLPTTKLANPTLPPGIGLPSLNNTAMTPEQAIAATKKLGSSDELTSSVEKLRADTIKSNTDLQSAYEKGLAALPKPGAEAEERLKAREAQDAIGQADAKGMAIFKAGLGMLAGTSPYAFENIGKGAMAGLEDYASSIKDFRKLAMERDKAYADIEAARNAAARDDFKTATGLREKANDRLMRVDEKGIDITANIFKTNKETAANIYRDSFDQVQQNARTAATNATSLGVAQINERGANARAQMGSPLNLYAQLGAAKEGSPLLKGYNIAKNEGQMERLFESYNKLVNDPINGDYWKRMYPTPDAYIKYYRESIGAGGNDGSGFVNPPPPNTAVLKPK